MLLLFQLFYCLFLAHQLLQNKKNLDFCYGLIFYIATLSYGLIIYIKWYFKRNSAPKKDLKCQEDEEIGACAKLTLVHVTQCRSFSCKHLQSFMLTPARDWHACAARVTIPIKLTHEFSRSSTSASMALNWDRSQSQSGSRGQTSLGPARPNRISNTCCWGN